jgi:hypothetical protein
MTSIEGTRPNVVIEVIAVIAVIASRIFLFTLGQVMSNPVLIPTIWTGSSR